MIIKKILNNNVVVTTNDNKEEIIVMGKGLAYGKKTGDVIDTGKINKTFEMSLKPSQRKMINMLKDIPIEYMEISDQVIQKAKRELYVLRYTLAFPILFSTFIISICFKRYSPTV